MIRTRHYAHSTETVSERHERLLRATEVPSTTPREYVAKADGLRWKGIVDGTEVRVTERWKPSKRARQHYSRQRAERQRQRTSAPMRHKADLALMARMGTIHESE